MVLAFYKCVALKAELFPLTGRVKVILGRNTNTRVKKASAEKAVREAMEK